MLLSKLNTLGTKEVVQFREGSGLEGVPDWRGFRIGGGWVWRGFGLEAVPDWRGFRIGEGSGLEGVLDWRGFGVLYVMNLIILPSPFPLPPLPFLEGDI